MKNILILGADGYLGWACTVALHQDGHKLTLVDNYSKRKYMKELNREPLVSLPKLKTRLASIDKTGHKIAFYDKDCANYLQLKSIIKKHKPEVIIHFAELPSAPFSMLNDMYGWKTLQNNLQSTFNVAHIIKEINPDCHIIKLGTMGEDGTPNIDIEEGWLKVNHNGRKEKFLYPRQASSLYHTSKIMDTDLLWFYTRMNNLKVTDLMQGPVYGLCVNSSDNKPMESTFTYDDIFGTVLNRFIVQAVAGIPLTVYGSGNQIRGYINIADTIDCIRLTLANTPKSGKLNIYNQFTQQFSVNELAKLVKTSLSKIGINTKITKISNPRIEKEKHYYNAKHTNIKKIGLKPTLLDSKVIIDIGKYVLKYKSKINKKIISPKVKWK